jgi:hypothetical protein
MQNRMSGPCSSSNPKSRDSWRSCVSGLQCVKLTPKTICFTKYSKISILKPSDDKRQRALMQLGIRSTMTRSNHQCVGRIDSASNLYSSNSLHYITYKSLFFSFNKYIGTQYSSRGPTSQSGQRHSESGSWGSSRPFLQPLQQFATIEPWD